MKKTVSTLIILIAAFSFASAQLLPAFQFGIKGGVDLASLSSGSTFSSSNQTGYLGGVWARFGALGFNFQPEMYVTSKDVNITSNSSGIQTQAKFTSLDVPLLFGGKVGALGFGVRFYTGPLFSFAINKSQSFSQAVGDAASLNYHDQNYAWQFGTGVDIQRISIDLRYEAGLNNQSYGSQTTKVSLFNLSLAYRLFKL
jgi:hypothetical protein